MIITITIDTSNAAFDFAPGEVSRILRELSCDYLQEDIDAGVEAELAILDSNGNRCGTVKQTKETS